MKRPSETLAATTLLCMTFASGTTLAVDGVIEINQVRAEAGALNAADAAGFPVTISEPGTYRLTGNLDVLPNGGTAQPDVHGIEIIADNVTLDLNGFEIFGAGASGSVGIAAMPGNITILNGTVRGWGSDGVRINGGAVVDNVRAIQNGGNGIDVAGPGSIVRDSVAAQNSGDGIATFTQSTVRGCTSTLNGGDGIQVGEGSTVTDNTVSLNNDQGIEADNGSTVRGNTVHDNAEDGILVMNGCTVADNTARKNGDHGICAFAGNQIVGNTLYNNTGVGIDMGLQNGFGRNVIASNVGGTVNVGVGSIEIAANACDGSTTCP